MAWFKFNISHTDPSFLTQIGALPGVSLRGNSILCHENAAWLVEKVCKKCGINYMVEMPTTDREPLGSIEELVQNGLRDWVPSYLTPYQTEGILATAHRDAHLWWAAGCLAGDTEVVVKMGAMISKTDLAYLVGIAQLEAQRNASGHFGRSSPIYVAAYDEKAGRFTWNKLLRGVDSGVKDLFRLRWSGAESGHIDATADHKFLTGRGWLPLAQVVEDDELVAYPAKNWHLPRSVERVSGVRVVSIEPLGQAPTYDLCMEAPHHNFVANGIVVHNSGKTLGAICWALAYPGATVMVTRAGVRRQHGREIERVTHHRALVVESAEDVDGIDDSDVLFAVVGYEMLPDLVDRLLLWRPTNVIFDEAHRAKSNKRWGATALSDGKVKFDPLENIAQAAYRLSRAVKRRLATTATPIKDRTRDLWAQLDLVHPDAWGRFYAKDKASFTGRYCAAREGMYGGIDTSGSANLDELWQRVSFVTHHVPHSVTHRHLPPRRRIVTYVTTAEQCRAEGFTQTFFKKAAKGGQTGLLEARLMEAAAKKRKVLIELVEEAVSCKQKVTIFTGRREDCERLAEDVKKATTCTVFMGHGGTSVRERDEIQQAYMRHPGPCVLVGTGDAWGEGVSLHDTDLALIAMLPYTPGAIVQWEGRFSRHGQKRPVLIQYLVAEGSVDEHVVEILLNKLRPVEDVSHDDSIDGFADSLRGADDEEAIVQSILTKLGV